MKKKLTILTFTSHYLPGFRGGGPIRTIANMVSTLGDQLLFKVLTLDRDLGCLQPYSGIHSNNWQPVGKAEVFYVSPEILNWKFLRRIITETPHDILYLNSFFSIYFGLIPMILHHVGLVPQKPMILANRGQFSNGALKLKSFKKRVYINFVKLLNLHKNVIWQVSSGYEKEDVCKIFQKSIKNQSQLTAIIAPDLPDIKMIENTKTSHKESGHIKIAFLSRISSKKNLDGALEMLEGLRGQILLNIFGPLEDIVYWKNCQRIIDKLSNNVQVRYQGLVNHKEVIRVLAEHNLFFLPTHGENFGHVILEALAAGCPVLISDQTPWRGLEEKGVGWDLPLDHPEHFTAILQQCIDMDHHDFSVYSVRARKYAERKMLDANAVKQNRDLFLNAI